MNLWFYLEPLSPKLDLQIIVGQCFLWNKQLIKCVAKIKIQSLIGSLFDRRASIELHTDGRSGDWSCSFTNQMISWRWWLGEWRPWCLIWGQLG
jgi:hypothetical protein